MNPRSRFRRRTEVRIRPGGVDWLVFRADFGIFSSIVQTDTSGYDSVMFRDMMRPIIEETLLSQLIFVSEKSGDLDLHLNYKEVRASDLILLEPMKDVQRAIIDFSP